MLKSRKPRIMQLTGAVFLAATLVACGNTEEPAPEPAPETSTVTENTEETSETSEESTSSETESSTETSESESESATAEPSESESEEPTETTSASSGSISEDVEDAYEIFGSIAPRELFEKFDSCDPVGNENNYNCSGPEVGQSSSPSLPTARPRPPRCSLSCAAPLSWKTAATALLAGPPSVAPLC